MHTGEACQNVITLVHICTEDVTVSCEKSITTPGQLLTTYSACLLNQAYTVSPVRECAAPF